MLILSPYGKDVARELRKAYGLGSVDELRHAILAHMAERYRMRGVEILSVHIAYGIAAKVGWGGRTYYLKLASRSMNRTPETLFPLIDYLARSGMPVPRVVRTVDGEWFETALPSGDYDVAYLMEEVPGELMREPSPARIRAYAETMAGYHRLGEGYEPRVLGGEASRIPLGERIASGLPRVVEGLASWSGILGDRGLGTVRSAAEHIGEATGERNGSELPRTHIHGDFRLCHVLYSGDEVSGILDIDESTYGERLVDVCYGAVSNPNPAGGSLLDVRGMRSFLARYDAALPFTPAERRTVKVVLLYALLELLADLRHFLETGQGGNALSDVTATLDVLANLLPMDAINLIPRRSPS